MNTEINASGGNRVVLVIAAIYNMFLTMSYGELAEYAVFALVGNVIGAMIWLLFKLLADRLGIGQGESKAKIQLPKRKKNE